MTRKSLEGFGNEGNVVFKGAHLPFEGTEEERLANFMVRKWRLKEEFREGMERSRNDGEVRQLLRRLLT